MHDMDTADLFEKNILFEMIAGNICKKFVIIEKKR